MATLPKIMLAHSPPPEQISSEVSQTSDSDDRRASPINTELRMESEKLQTVNQDLQVINEEFQVVNEELQTVNEELQAVNEELQVVNEELNRKIAELDRANADLINVFASIQIPVIFLYLDGRIARFNPQATAIFALIDSDIGRMITDLNAHFCDDDMHILIAEALESLALVDRIIHQPTQDRWWNMHIQPYRTLTDEISGVVMTFTDITTLKQTEVALQESCDVLEQRVTVRTRELGLMNLALQAEMAERIRSEQAREEILQRLVTAQEEERRHIARELHDQMSQDLTALILGLKVLQNNGDLGAPTVEHIAQLQTMAVQISEDVRNLAVELRPLVLDDLGLVIALSNYVEQWSARANVAVDLHVSELDGVHLPLAVETTLYRLVQEALNNVRKHAQAFEVSVIIERRTNEVRLIVEDDGVGFAILDPSRAPDPTVQLNPTLQLGLIGMQERVMILGGTLAIESSLGSGTTIFVRIPLPIARK